MNTYRDLITICEKFEIPGTNNLKAYIMRERLVPSDILKLRHIKFIKALKFKKTLLQLSNEVDIEFEKDDLKIFIPNSEKLHCVSILNDETHSFNDVVEILSKGTRKSYQEIMNIAWKAHLNGECVAFTSKELEECKRVKQIFKEIDLGAYIGEVETRVDDRIMPFVMETPIQLTCVPKPETVCQIDAMKSLGKDENDFYHDVVEKLYQGSPHLDAIRRWMLYVYTWGMVPQIFVGPYVECQKHAKWIEAKGYLCRIRIFTGQSVMGSEENPDDNDDDIDEEQDVDDDVEDEEEEPEDDGDEDEEEVFDEEIEME